MTGYDPAAPVKALQQTRPPPLAPWKAGTTYRKNNPVTAAGAAWLCAAEHKADKSNAPGSPAGSGYCARGRPAHRLRAGPAAVTPPARCSGPD